MTNLIKPALLAIALTIGGSAAVAQTEAASAPPQNYPVCSKTVTDECINPDAVPHKAGHRMSHLAGPKARHHRSARHARHATAAPAAAAAAKGT